VLASRLGAVVSKHVLAQAIKGDAFEEAGRDDPVGVNVIAHQRDPSACDA
jgi:hypothetical protein